MSQTRTTIAKILAWVPLGIVAISVAASWGANSERNKNQDERIIKLEERDLKVNTLDARQQRIDERTQGIQRQLDRIENLIRDRRPQPRQ